MHNIGCGWTAQPRRCFLGSYFVPFNQFPAPVASTRPNEFILILMGQAMEDSRMFSMLCSVTSQNRDTVFACRFPVFSWLPPSPPCLQQSQDRPQAVPQLWHCQALHVGSQGCKPCTYPIEEKTSPGTCGRKPSLRVQIP